MSTDLTAEHAAERRAAARLLLRCPLVTPQSHPDEFGVLRRHAEELGRMFNQYLGYRLVVEPGFARLHKTGLGDHSGHRLERSGGAPFTPRTYAYLALTLSVLVTAPEQLLLSELLTSIRVAAVEAGIDLADVSPSAGQRAVVAVLTRLLEWEVLHENEGSVGAYVDDDGAEALLTVNRELARRMVSGPISRADGPGELIAGAEEPGPGGPRHFVRRRLVETPVVYLDELTAVERGWLRQQQRREQRTLEELLGLDMEIRAEGVAVIDPAGELTDIDFPGTGTVPQAALLLAHRLVVRLMPDDAGHPAAGGRLVIGVRIPDELIDSELAALVERHQRHWATRFVQAPVALREAVTDLLHRMGLLCPVGPTRADGDSTPDSTDRQVTDVRDARGGGDSGWVLLAAAARFVPDPTVRGSAERATAR